MKKAQLQAQAQGGLYELNGEYVVAIHQELANKVGVTDSELRSWGKLVSVKCTIYLNDFMKELLLVRKS